VLDAKARDKRRTVTALIAQAVWLWVQSRGKYMLAGWLRFGSPWRSGRSFWAACLLGALAGCVSAAPQAPITDADEAAIASSLRAGALRVAEDVLSENTITFRIRTFTARASGPTFLILHDDEQDSFLAAAKWAADFGGRVVALESGEARRVSGVDPNRIFNQRFPRFTNAIAALFPGDAPIITLHNNRNGFGPPDSSISVQRWLDGERVRSFDHGGDEDDLVWLAGTTPLAANPRAQAHLERLRAQGINVVYEWVQAPGDGSLSNWAALNGRLYVNIEAEHGALARQETLLAAVMALEGFAPPPRRVG
jgi:hypothetical protein